MMANKKQPPVAAIAELPLRLEWRSPAELAENPANWRTHPDNQLAALTDVMAEVGWAGACLYNERTKRLIDGHARRKVALDQGTERVPVLVGNWTEEQEKKILATLDPLAAMAEANTEALDALLRDVQTGSEALAGMLTELAAQGGVIPKRLPTEAANDPAAEWQGMPEFEHEDLTPKQSINVHFKSSEDAAAFAKLVGQTITENTKAIWYPKAEVIRYGDAE